MATIPLGDFGQAVARPGQAPSIPRGNPIGQAVERTGQVAAQVVDERGMELRRERERQEAQERQERAQAAEAAARTHAITTLTGAKDGLADLHDRITRGVLDGTVPKAKAESDFVAEAGKLLQGAGGDLSQEQRDAVVAELTRDAARLGNSVRKAVTQRDRQDVTSGISQTLEYLQRQYRADPAKATQQAMDLVDQLGPHSTLNPEQLAKLKQSWKEGTQYTAGYELVSAGRADRKMLDAAEKTISTGLPDIDPQKRATLLDRIAAYRLHLDQKAELAAARAQREAERRLKLAEAEFNTFQVMADKGTILDPAYIDRALTATSGTPYQSGVRALAQQAKDMGGLAAQPVQQQQMLLDQVNALIAQRGRSPELDKRKDQIEKVLRGSQQDLYRDGLRAGLERGVITDLKPLDQSGGIPGLIQQLQARVPLAQRVSMWAGRQVSPMTDEEAAQLKHQLDALPAKERSGMVATLAQAIGPQAAQGLAVQMDKKDKGMALAFAFSGSQTTEGRFTSELLLKGQQAKLDGTSTKGEKQPDLKPAQWSAHIAAELDGVFPAQTLTDQTREAAVLIAHGIASEQGGRLSTKDLDRAVRLAVGGSVVEHNGRKVLLPAGVDEDMLAKRLRSISAEELAKQAPEGQVRAGGVPMPVADFVKTLPGQQLMYAAPGKYVVIVSGRPVLNAKGQPIIVGVQ